MQAADQLAVDDPECGIRWTLLAAIGRVESNHGRFGGAQLRDDGYGTRPIRGIPLDGRPDVALIRDTDGGRLDGDTTYDRAVGPMQFIPSTWQSVGVDADGDGRRDPNNIFDAAQGAAVYLCRGDADLRDAGGAGAGGPAVQQRRPVRPRGARPGRELRLGRRRPAAVDRPAVPRAHAPAAPDARPATDGARSRDAARVRAGAARAPAGRGCADAGASRACPGARGPPALDPTPAPPPPAPSTPGAGTGSTVAADLGGTCPAHPTGPEPPPTTTPDDPIPPPTRRRFPPSHRPTLPRSRVPATRPRCDRTARGGARRRRMGSGHARGRRRDHRGRHGRARTGGADRARLGARLPQGDPPPGTQAAPCRSRALRVGAFEGRAGRPGGQPARASRAAFAS